MKRFTKIVMAAVLMVFLASVARAAPVTYTYDPDDFAFSTWTWTFDLTDPAHGFDEITFAELNIAVDNDWGWDLGLDITLYDGENYFDYELIPSLNEGEDYYLVTLDSFLPPLDLDVNDYLQVSLALAEPYMLGTETFNFLWSTLEVDGMMVPIPGAVWLLGSGLLGLVGLRRKFKS